MQGLTGECATASRAGAEALARHADRLRTWLLDGALPLWWRLGADHRGGGFHEALEQDGAPAPVARRCRLHPRQAVAFTLGARLGWPGPARQAAMHAMDWFVAKYRRPDGLYRASVEIDGRARDDRALLYDQAFALLGFFAVNDLDPRPAHIEAAEALMTEIRRVFAHPAGGFREHDDAPFQSNAQMHLFEACLAWASVVGGSFAETADELGELCLRRLIDRELGVIDEFYDEAWRPVGLGGPRRIEPGHQYEWAWLLLQWRAGDSETLGAAWRLFEIGEASVGPCGTAPAAISVDGAVADSAARLWPQTERLRTAAWLARRNGGDGFAAAVAENAAASLERYLAMPLSGLWRDTLRPDGAFLEGPSPASSLYHLAGAIAAQNGVVLAGAPQVEPAG